MSKKIYYAVNAAVLLITIFLLFSMVTNLLLRNCSCSNQWLIPLLGAAFCTGSMYLLKGFRLYFILMEKRVELKRFLRIYAKTTLVTVVLPWKLGEFFRIFCYGEELRDYRSSLLSVLVDRYFDTIPILFIVFSSQIARPSNISLLTWALLIFLICATVTYLIFPSLYQYFNRFLIMKVTSKHSVTALETLENLHRWYCYINNLVKNREILLTFLSSVAWFFEYIALYCLALILNSSFDVHSFALYLDHIFSGAIGNLEVFYVSEGALLLLITVLLVYGISFIKTGRNED